MNAYSQLTTGCAGFLAAVLWFDLMFDVQVMSFINTPAATPDAALDSIKTYYLRVTTDASPMGSLVGFVMMVGIITNLVRLVRSSEALWKRASSVILMCVPTSWALISIVPAAVALAESSVDRQAQIELAIYILQAHIACLIMIVLLLALQWVPDRTGD